ncbi:MAG: enoyl-CoA hydratase/isomerase family protein [Syntrophomonadaceae bacterium]|jgi:enoyl-CoA hydratase/carnithine racemase|nr:enoyl-CoA hydratase/isomerase family protein [Syntrophomonadaceae bacterium]
MKWETVSFEKQGRIVILTLNKPETLNALSFQMRDEFAEAINQVQQDKEARVVIIRGEGKSFCSGGDLKSTFDMYDDPPAKAQQNAFNFYKGFLSLRNLEIPVIAVIHGHTIGAGLCLAMASDMIIAGSDAKISMSFIKVGINPGMGGTYFLPRLVGTAKAMEMCLLGEAITARQALDIGLVNHVVEPSELMDFALDFAGRIANNPPVAARLIKKGIYQGLNKSLDEVLTFEAFAQVTCSSTGDMKEAVTAFKEKRPPVFTGS